MSLFEKKEILVRLKRKKEKKTATKPKSMPRLNNNNNNKNQAEALFFPESGRAMEWFLSSEHCP